MKDYFEEKYSIEIDQCDLNFNLKIVEILKISERISMHHACKYNLGKKFTFDKGFGWIVSRIKIDIKRIPKFEEILNIKSFAYEGFRNIYPRIISFYDSKNKKIIKVTMLWHLLNYKTKEISPVPKRKNYFCKEKFSFEKDMPKSIKTINENFENFLTKKISFNDIDYNNHLNNLKYIEYSLSKEKTSFCETKEIKTVLLQFINEVKDSETIFFYKTKYKNNCIKFVAKRKDVDVFKMEEQFK